jgi:hypothetical protein
MQPAIKTIYDFANQTVEDLQKRPLQFRLTPESRKCLNCLDIIITQKRTDYGWKHFCCHCQKEV